MKVLDASVLVEYLSGGELSAESGRRMRESSGWLWAPALVDAEVGQALRRAVRGGHLSQKAARGALTDVLEMRLQRVSHHLLADRAWALRDNLSFYDGLYVALAEALEAPLLTLDARISKVRGVRAEIELVQAA